MSALISVIVPVYNVEKYLKRCLSSILNNTYKNLEVICINDGSTDNSMDILEYFKNQDSRIIILSQSNKGIAETRNRGLEAATGDYISFVDSDDWIHKNFFESLLYYCELNQCQISMCKYTVTQSEVIEDLSIDPHNLQCQIIKGDNIVLNMWTKRGYLWNCLYKKEVLKGLSFKHFKIEDIPFKIDLFAKGQGTISIVLLDSELYYYYQRPNSSVRSQDATSRLVVYNYLLEQHDSATSEASKRLYLLYLSKMLLRYRYKMMYELSSSQKKEVNKTLKNCAARLFSSDCGISWKYKLIHVAFLRHSSLYRLFRIIEDPSMLKYEKKLKSGDAQQWNRFRNK